MAITFLQAKKRQRHLILILALIIFIIILVIWWGFFREEKPVSPIPSVLTPSGIEIDWDILKDIKLKELKLFEEITIFEDESGRGNPFTPY